jgi:cell wall-associated protease
LQYQLLSGTSINLLYQHQLLSLLPENSVHIMKKLILFQALIALSLHLFAQNAVSNLNGWHIKNFGTDGYYGISLEQAYKFLADKKIKSTPVIVAVLDSGVDTLHEDLTSILWVNPGEVPGNGIDDDKNGYIDDVHGWNFLGNPDGRNVNSTSSEWIRVYWRYKQRYEGKQTDTALLSREERYDYAQWQKARGGVVGKGMNEEQLNNLRQMMSNLRFCDSIFKQKFGRTEYTLKEVEDMRTTNEQEKNIKQFYTEVFKNVADKLSTNSLLINDAGNYVLGEERRASGDKVPPEDNRTSITGDDEKNLNTIYYGNNDIQAATAEHGTHVSGIIAAARSNGTGMDGIADNVRIMFVRTTPDGDEHDKDIALAIRYAVNNGAKVINMSFGKSLSPGKKMIDEAVRYAAAKNVLLVHAAGNSKRNIDGFDNFPNPRYLFTDSLATNWITVGACDEMGLAADFSNYGKKVVDVFSPGMAIYSTFPGGNKYKSWEGTSMAAPVVTGVAALLRSYFPNLTGAQVKNIITQSAAKPVVASTQPGTEKKVSMAELCSSGGIVNALNAVMLAAKYK